MPGDADGLRITVLGGVTASRQGELLDLGGRRQRAVLALLVLARGDAMPAERLVDLLWGDEPPPGASGALQSYISHLRRRLEPERAARSRGSVIVRLGPAGYALAVGPDTVDAWRFEGLLRQADALAGPDERLAVLGGALGLWRGPAFTEYRDESWARGEITRLGELREVAREQLVAARLARGESAVVVPDIEALVAEAPLREERWRLLVLALYRAHRQGDALAALRRARGVLADELGIDPGPALRALEAEILTQSPALAIPVAAGPVPVSAPASAGTGGAPVAVPTAREPGAGAMAGRADPPPARRRAAEDLVGREREVAELAGCVDDAVDGQARLVVIEGPAGIGKTRLLAEARQLAAGRGVRVLTARGSGLEKEFAFGAVRQLFEAAVAGQGAGGDVLAGPAARAATVFDVQDAAPASTVDAPARPDTSVAVLHGLYWLTVRLAADGPVLLAVDDLQWCDSASLRFLSYLARRAEGQPLAIVATLRTGEPSEDEGLLAELTGDPGTIVIRPAPLGRDGVADLVRARLGGRAEDAFVAACHQATAGNPLYVRQLLRALQSEGITPDGAHAGAVSAIGSRAVSSLVLMRLARMPGESVAVARWIAVLGGGAVLPTVATLAGLSEASTAAAVGTLARAEVLRDDYPLGFVHPLVADAVYRDIPPGERQLHHDRAARALHRSGAAPEQIAAHLLQVPHRGDAWAVDILRQAATRARARGAPDAAAAYLARALREQPEPATRGPLLVELAQAAVLTDAIAAVTHLTEAYEALEVGSQRVQVAQMLTRALVFAGSPSEATRFGNRVAEELPADLDDDRQGLLGLARIGGYMNDLDPALWRRSPAPAVTGAGPGARMLAAALAWESLLDGTGRAGAIDRARFAAADGVLTRVDLGLLWTVAGVTLHLAGEDTQWLWEDGLAHAHRVGSVFGALAANLWRGYAEWGHGDLRAARQSFQVASDQSRTWGLSFGSGYSNAYLIGVLVDAGELTAARAHADRVARDPRSAEGNRLFGEMLARLLVAEGRHEEALASLDEVRSLMACAHNPAWWPWRSTRALALAGLGRHREAITLVEEELALARGWGEPGFVGRTLRLLGELRAQQGDAVGHASPRGAGGDAAGLAELREADALLAPSPSRLEHARALHALGRREDPAQAIRLLRQAADLAWRCGAGALHARVSDDLAALGQPQSPLP
ncbi:BTAD domain-containing putative transcriptional regulator, partial [Frankia canadensis]|uniref:BTAD domain-containing putative transcriptional regulator n=1 Tax=Frankia canadensis TaxID=1836972 RepID=UPI001FB005F6